MLRVGLTGDLGSGKSTVAQMLQERGAVIFSSDDMGRQLMQPGHEVFEQIVERFGAEIVGEDGKLDRAKLAALAFDAKQPRLEELNAIVHPAVLAAQAGMLDALERKEPRAIAVVESALIFSTKHALATRGSDEHASEGSRRQRFDCIVMVTAPEAAKIARYVQRIAGSRQLSLEQRTALEDDARHRLRAQDNAAFARECVLLINDGDLKQLQQHVDALWRMLVELQ